MVVFDFVSELHFIRLHCFFYFNFFIIWALLCTKMHADSNV